jgi:hypothetical protein
MTPAALAQALRESEQRRLAETSDSELIQDFNTCVHCDSPILSPEQLAVVIAEAESLEEFYELFDEARDDEEDGEEDYRNN